jgi:AraC-like DNA-binding protein
MAARWLPNVEEFFYSYCRVLMDGLNLEDIEDDRADFFARRIEDYEQTVRVLAARLLEAFPVELTLHNNMLRLLDISANIRTRLQDRLIEQENRELDNSEETYQAPVERLDNQEQGRPRLAVNETDANDLRRLGFSWTDIASMLGVSSRTLRRRRHESGTFNPIAYSGISDNELDNIIREVLETTPQAGRNLVRGAVLSRGLHVQRRRIESSISRVDPVTTALRDRRRIIRRIYNVPCPNFLW